MDRITIFTVIANLLFSYGRTYDDCVVVQTSSLSSDMVGIPTADEFMKRREEFDAKIDDDLNAGLLLVVRR